MQSMSVSSETLAYCGSCKMDLNHIIVAMKGKKIAKVQCLTCKKEHMYRAPKNQTEPMKAEKSEKLDKVERAEKKAQESQEFHRNSIENEWKKLIAAHKNAPVKPYEHRSHYLLGDRIKHSTFGEGIIGRIIHPNKIEVIFQYDVKILICAPTE